MHRFKKRLSVLFSLLLVFSFVNGFAPADVRAEGDVPITSVDAPAPFIEPDTANGMKVLFDNTHGETAGAADWVINGGFSDFGTAIADSGYFVKELRKTSPITYDDLKDYQVFVIPEANVPFKDSEQDAILQFVNNGGSVFFVGDHYNADRNLNRWDAGEVFNGYRRGAFGDPTKGMGTEEANSVAMQGVSSTDWLSTNFGIRFRFNALGDGAAHDIVPANDSFGITEGVDSVAIHAGATLAITDPTKAKGLVYVPEGMAAWGPAVDQGVYANGGRDEGAFVAISKVGKGKAAFVGDSSVVEDATPVYVREDTGKAKTTYDGFKEENDDTLLINLINWLAQQEDYTSFENQGVTLDEVTPLLTFEAPEASTEPEAEPWSAPPAGYKWWDRTTFQAGSYGSGTLAVDPTYEVVHQDVLPGGMQEFAIRLTGEKLAPFATESGFRVGIYLDGGMQVAQFSLDGEHWSTSYGYSDYFNLVADMNGHAEKDLYVRIKSDVTGKAKLRLKQGSSNVFTKEITIDPNATPEELPEGNSPTIPEPTELTKARAMQDGASVTVQGIIVSEPGIFGAQGFYVQDETGGIYVYQDQAGLHAGDVVSVTGKLTTFRTEREITNPSIVKINSTTVPKPIVVTDLSQENQGQFVQLKEVTIRNIHSAGSAFEFDALKGDQKTTVRVDSRTGITIDNFPYKEGDVADLSGISAIFNGKYQLKPTQWTDLNYVYKISQARDLGANQEVTVKGVVTTETGLWGGKAFYIQDETGGAYVYTSEQFNVEPGDVVKLTATTAIFNDEFELTDITSLEKVGESELPQVKVVTPSGVADHQGELIQLEAVKVTDLHRVDKFGTTEFTAVSQDGTAVVVRLDNRTGTSFDEFPYQEGDVLFVTGIGSRFKDTLQVKPRSIDDFTLLNIDWIKEYVTNSSIEPNGIKTSILAKLDASAKNAKHLDQLIHFIDKQPSKHIGEEVKERVLYFIRALQQ